MLDKDMSEEKRPVKENIKYHNDERYDKLYSKAVGRHPEQNPVIKVRHLRKVYHMGEEKIVALDRVSLDIYKGEIICLLGTSGSGKSTFLNMLAGLEKPSKGEVYFSQIPVHTLDEEQITLFRQKNIGFIFQAYHLLPTLTALENVAIPLAFKGVSLKERTEKAKYYLERVGIGALLGRKPAQMSGGQQQRVGIARALTVDPKIIFADEPTGNLDSRSTREVLDLIYKIVREKQQILILVTHDPKLAQYADVVVTLRDGNIIKLEEKGEVLAEVENLPDPWSDINVK